MVIALNQKRSVEIGLLREDGWHSAGNVTVPPSHLPPQVGDVVEVRYLYAFPESGAVYQPVFLGVRADVDASQCLASQLKFKSTERSDESES